MAKNTLSSTVKLNGSIKGKSFPKGKRFLAYSPFISYHDKGIFLDDNHVLSIPVVLSVADIRLSAYEKAYVKLRRLFLSYSRNDGFITEHVDNAYNSVVLVDCSSYLFDEVNKNPDGVHLWELRELGDRGKMTACSILE